jgi:polyisoprenoid-binding protein YceI
MPPLSRLRLRRPRLTGLFLLYCAVSPAMAAEPKPPPSAIRSYAFDAAGSRLGFTVTRPGEVVEGTATQFAGTVKLDPEHPEAGAGVTLEVDAATMVTGNRLRDRTMRNSHLETEKYPKIRFQSASATPAKPGPLHSGETRGFELEGTLSLHGVDRTVRIPVMVGYDGALLTADGNVSFTLTEYSIPIPKIFWIVLDDKVTVHFHAVAKPGNAAAAPAGASSR